MDSCKQENKMTTGYGKGGCYEKTRKADNCLDNGIYHGMESGDGAGGTSAGSGDDKGTC